MKRKWGAVAGLLASLLLLTSCGLFYSSETAQPTKEGTTSVQPEPSAIVTTVPSSSESPSAVLLASVVKRYDKTLLLAGTSGQAGEVYLVPYEEIPLLDTRGNSISPQQIQPGKIVAVSHSGMVMETYPAQIAPVQIQLKDEPVSAVSLYTKVLEELYKEDPGLNENIRILAFDFTKAASLTPAEKSALCYWMGTVYQKETLEGTFEQLCQEGYIDKEAMYFPDGLLFSISDTVAENGTVKFSVSKWRSGLGAYGWNNCTAQRGEAGWAYETGDAWIS